MSEKADDDSGLDQTVLAPAGPTRTKPPSMPPVVSTSTAPTGVGRSTIGNELRGASIERFSPVSRERFELLDELARGGLGRVFRARDPRTGRIVAIKEVLRPQADIILRFAREALVTANLQHPSIVPVYEVGRWPGGEPFYAMKLVEGRTLEALIKEAKTTEQRVALLAHVIDVAEALAYAHGEHVIHRDLKPANVLVGAYGETVVIDWGLAKNVQTGEEIDALPVATTLPPEQDETQAGIVVGTPAYMPPEQALGDKLDERADVYAIGAILYHALGGRRPYVEAQSIGELIELVANRPPRPLAELAPDLPAELLAIVAKAMARDPRQRYPTAQELALDLRRFQAGQIVGAHRYTSWQLVRRWIARHRALVATTSVALVVLLVVGSLAVRRIAEERDEASRQRGVAQRERGEAHAARELAERRYADSLEELARQALLANAPDRALPLLVAAREARGGTSATLDLLGQRAITAYAGLAGLAPAQPTGTTSGFVVGRTLISAERGGTIRAWDLDARAEAWAQPGAWLIQGSADGSLILGVDTAGGVGVWRSIDGTRVQQWQLPPGPDGTQDIPSLLAWDGGVKLAVATSAGRVFVGAHDATALVAGEPHAGPVYGLAFSPDGATLATVGADGMTALRDPGTGRIRARLADGAPTELAAVAWIDEQRIITGDDRGDARIWSTATRRLERTLRHPADIYGVAAGRGASKWVATFGHGSVVVVWDPDTGKVLARLDGHVHGTDVAGAWGSSLITTDEAGNAYAWDAVTGQRILSFPNEGSIANLAVSAHHGITFIGEERLRVWSSPDTGVTQLPSHTARVRALEFSPDGAWLWSASHDGTARGLELATGTAVVLGAPDQFAEPPLRALPSTPPPLNPRGLRSLRLTPDGASVATASEDGVIALWDARTSSPTPRVTWRGHTGRVRQLVFTRDGKTAFSVGDTTLRRWDVATGVQTHEVALSDTGWDLVLYDDDRVVAAMTDDQRLVLARAADLAPIAAPAERHLPSTLAAAGDRFLLASDTRIATLAPDGSVVTAATFVRPSAISLGPDAAPRWAAVGGQLGDTTLFTWPALEPVRTWRADQGVTAIRFRPDAAVVASVSDRFVRLWDPASGRLLAELEASFLLTQLAWSPDGYRLAAAGASGTILVWSFTPPTADNLADVTRCVSPWQLDESVLVARPFDPARCTMLTR